MPAAAQEIARTLSASGVDLVFGLPGIHNMGLWPHLRDAGIRVMGSRHEQGTVYAADGYARTTGRVGVALTTTGPGVANTLGAMGEAWASRSPVVLIGTDIPSDLRRPGVYRGVVHECLDQCAMFAPVTKATLRATSEDEVVELAARALEIALTAPRGPVYLEYPADYFAAQTTAHGRAIEPLAQSTPDPAGIEALRDALDAAERPLIWVGGGGRDAGPQLDALARKLGAPVVTTFQARGVLPDTHPLLVNLPPHEPAITALIEQADLLLVVGSDLDQMMTQGWRLPLPERRIAINVDADDATKNYAMERVIVGDAGLTLDPLKCRLHPRAPWAGDLRALEAEVLEEIAAEPDTAEAAEYLATLERAIPKGTIVFADMAVPGYWASAYYRVREPRSLHFPMGWGTLGFALPASVGAAAAGRGPVVSMNGDGGALFALGELATVAEEALPLTIVIVDDGGYGMLRYGKDVSENAFGTELATPDFATIARGFGLDAVTVDGVDDAFADALAAGIASGKPNLVLAHARMTPPRTTSPRWPLRDRAMVVA
jgi:acetolactate synthase-1/2/3 large subunit